MRDTLKIQKSQWFWIVWRNIDRGTTMKIGGEPDMTKAQRRLAQYPGERGVKFEIVEEWLPKKTIEAMMRTRFVPARK